MARDNNQNQGRDSQGRFKEGSQAAKEAGRKGGKTAQRKGSAHSFSRDERERGGENSNSGGRQG